VQRIFVEHNDAVLLFDELPDIDPGFMEHRPLPPDPWEREPWEREPNDVITVQINHTVDPQPVDPQPVAPTPFYYRVRPYRGGEDI